MDRPGKGSKAASGPQPIAQVIRQFLAANNLRRTRTDERVFAAWSEVAGARWRTTAVPVAFRGGQLTVETGSSVDLAELKGFHGEDLRAKANALLGEPLVHKVVFKLKSSGH